MRIKKLRRELKQELKDHGNIEVEMAQYGGYGNEARVDGTELLRRYNYGTELPPVLRLW
jgi:hypothetical protein